jgi:hypothetical protein
MKLRLSLLLALLPSLSWAIFIPPTKELPAQTGNSGKYLTTNGTVPSWGTPAGSGDMLEADWATDGKISDAKLPDGLTRDAETQGTFTGTTIPDGQTIKEALQALETAVEAAGAPDDTAYDATSWDANTDAATKNAIRDKIETIASVPTGTSCVVERDAGGSAVCTTPVNLSDPNAHRVLGWDDTDGAVKMQTVSGATYDAATDTWTVDSQAASSQTLTNKTFDFAGTGNSVTTYQTKDGGILDPADADDHFWFKAPRAITLTNIHCITIGGTSITLTLQECDSAGANCASLEAITCDTDGAADDGSISDASIDAGDWVKVLYGAPTGTVDALTYSIHYSEVQ